MKSPPSLQSLKARLAGLSRLGATGSQDDGGNAANGRMASAAELRARLKARLEQLSQDSAGLGASLNAKVETLLKPRRADGGTAIQQPESLALDRPPSVDADVAVPEAVPLPPTVATPQPVARDNIVTRTINRVGLTAVHARLGALSRVRKKTPALLPVSSPTSPGHSIEPHIQRIDSDMPLLETAVMPVAGGAASAFAGALPSIAPPIDLKPRSVTQEATRRRRASGRSRMASLFMMLLTAFVTAALVHIAVTLSMPTLAGWFGKGTAFDRLRFKLEANAMKPLKLDVTGSEPLLPFLTPDMQYAFCRYDLSASSVAVTATLVDVGWSLALYTPQGDNFYAAPGIEGRATELSFVIVPSSERLLILPGVRRADVDAAQVTSPTREGLIVVRAPNKGRAFEASTKAALAKADCRPITRR